MKRLDDRTETNIATLHPKAQEAARKFMSAVIPAMAAKGVVVKIISGTRTYAEQDALYAKGRTTPGPRVTNARGGFSNHNFGVAWDIGLFNDGKYLQHSPFYRACGQIGRDMGLEWGGDWKSIKDEPHFEVKTGLTISQKRDRIAKNLSLF